MACCIANDRCSLDGKRPFNFKFVLMGDRVIKKCHILAGDSVLRSWRSPVFCIRLSSFVFLWIYRHVRRHFSSSRCPISRAGSRVRSFYVGVTYSRSQNPNIVNIKSILFVSPLVFTTPMPRGRSWVIVPNCWRKREDSLSIKRLARKLGRPYLIKDHCLWSSRDRHTMECECANHGEISWHNKVNNLADAWAAIRRNSVLVLECKALLRFPVGVQRDLEHILPKRSFEALWSWSSRSLQQLLFEPASPRQTRMVNDTLNSSDAFGKGHLCQQRRLSFAILFHW